VGYKFKAGESVPDGARRIVDEQLERAIGRTGAAPSDRDEAVHDIRKRMKKCRAVLRLVRGGLGSRRYREANAAFREAASRIALARDAAVHMETLDGIRRIYRSEIAKGAFAGFRKRLQGERTKARRADLQQDSGLEAVRELLEQAKTLPQSWKIKDRGFDILADGIGRVYNRATTAMENAYASGNAEDFHEWRKGVKYLWFHTRILKPVWPAVMSCWEEELGHLGSLLGDHHDLAELARVAGEHKDSFRDGEELSALLALVARRQKEIEKRAEPLGRRLFAQGKKHFVRSLRLWWGIWHA
jgi:CHAD domain-containing protein